MTIQIKLTGLKPDCCNEDFLRGKHYGKRRFERQERNYIGGYQVINLTTGDELIDVRVFDTGRVATCCIWVRLENGSVSSTISVKASSGRLTAITSALSEIFEIENLGHYEGRGLIETLLKSGGEVIAGIRGQEARILVLENHA